MESNMNRYCCLLFILIALGLTGCSVAGSANTPKEDDSVTLLATVNAPQINTAGILAAVADVNDAAAFARFVASSTCRVNGVKAAFSLDSQSRELKVEKLNPAAGYLLSLECGNLKLSSYVAHTGRRISMPYGVSLRSTAELSLRKKIADLESLELSQLNAYSVDTALIDAVHADLVTELKKNDTSAGRFDQLLADRTGNAVSGRSFAQCLQRSGSAFVYNGRYGGKVYYYTLNGAGAPVYAVQAQATLECSQSGSLVTGNLKLEPISIVPLIANSGVIEPGIMAFAFSATVSSSNLVFVRKGVANGSPLSGKDIDSWFLFPVQGGLACRAANLDKAYFTGIHSRAGEFVLQKK
jgi:hypothetical protein